MKKFLLIVFTVVILTSCEERANENLISQYEAGLEKNVTDYEFKNFEWLNTYTVKDSLQNELEKIESSMNKAGQEASFHLDKNDYESQASRRDLNLKKAEIQLNLMKDLETLLQEKKEEYEAITDSTDRVIRKKAVHTFVAKKGGSEEVYKVIVTFDGEGNFLEKGVVVDALQFENLSELNKQLQ